MTDNGFMIFIKIILTELIHLSKRRQSHGYSG
jgi:hypothetical protein